MARIRVLETALRANTAQFESGMNRARLVTGNFERTAARFVRFGARGFSAGLSALSVSALAFENRIASMAAGVAAAFAVGGPVGGSIALAGIAIGTLASKAAEASKKWNDSMTAMRKETDKFRESAIKAEDELFALLGGDRLQRSLDQTLDAIQTERNALREFQRAAWRIAPGFEDIPEGVPIGSTDEFAKRQAKIRELERRAANIRHEQDVRDQIESRKAIESRIEEMNTAFERAREQALAPAREFGRSIASTLTGGIASAVEAGFSSASLAAFANRVRSMVLNAVLEGLLAKPAARIGESIYSAIFPPNPVSVPVGRER